MSKNLSQQVVLDRRGFVAATFATVAGLGLAGCSDTSAEADKGSAAGSSKSSNDTEASTTLDAKAFDKLVDNGPKADDDAIAASTWATAVKDAGVFKIGGVPTSTLFSHLNEKAGKIRGFDAGIAQLLSNYILGENKVEITQVTSDTRESVLQNGQVDAVFATYTITDERKKSWDFSTPYRTDYVGLMVKKRSGFTSIEDLDGKVIGVSQGATTQSLIEQMIKDNGFSCEPEFRAFSGYPIIKSSLDAGNIDVFAMDRSTLAGYMNETVELLQPEVKFGEQGYGVATKKGCDLSAVVDQVICDRLADGWLDQEVKTWGLV